MVVIGLAVMHHVDQLLRADSGGWSFAIGLLLYPALLSSLFLFRTRPWIRVALVALSLVIFQWAVMFVDIPGGQYGTWARGTSSALHAIGKPNLLGIASPALGVVSVTVSLLLTAASALAPALLTAEVRTLRRAGRTAAAVMFVLILLTDAGYGWAARSTDTSLLARMVVWQGSDVLDHRRFPARTIDSRPPAFRFTRAQGADRIPAQTVPVRDGESVTERDLETFLRSTGTTAFIAIKGDAIRHEVYFNGYRHDSTFASFSVAKPFVSALVGIALADGHLGSVTREPSTSPSSAPCT